MSFEPIVIYARSGDPAAVVEALQRMTSGLKVHGPQENWERLEVPLKKRLFRPARTLTLGHDAEYYQGPGWLTQRSGMRGYFERFPETATKTDVLRVVDSLGFALSVPTDDLDIDSDDGRLKFVFAVCEALDAVIFTPTSLRDAAGRVLIDAGGGFDPAAVFPQLPRPAQGHVAGVREGVDWQDGDQQVAPNEQEEEERDEDGNYVHPSARRIARRALVLTALAARATLEMDTEQGIVEQPEPHRLTLLHWLGALALEGELEPWELAVLEQPVGELTPQQLVDAMWRVEGLTVLAWALGLHELPAYDEVVSPLGLYSAMGLVDLDAGQRLLSAPRVRAQGELNVVTAHYLAFHWRTRDFKLRGKVVDFVAFSKDCWFGSFDLSNFHIIDGDLAIGEHTIVDADPNLVERAGSIALERHKAAMWLQGDSEIYSDTDTST